MAADDVQDEVEFPPFMKASEDPVDVFRGGSGVNAYGVEVMHSQDDIIGDLFDDAANAITHPADTFNSAVTIAVHPEDDFNAVLKNGPDALVSAVNQTWRRAGATADWAGHGLSDFAKSSVGKTLMDIAAGATFMVLMVSPFAPLAYLVFAVPGMMRGDEFSTAWLHGMFDQGIRIAKAVSGGNIDIPLPPEVADHIQDLQDVFSSQTGTAATFLEQNEKVLQTLGLPTLDQLDFVQLAAKLGIREDAAEAALVNMRNNADELLKWKGMVASGFFDPVTGRANLTATQRRVSSTLHAGHIAQLIALNAHATEHIQTSVQNSRQASRILGPAPAPAPPPAPVPDNALAAKPVPRGPAVNGPASPGTSQNALAHQAAIANAPALGYVKVGLLQMVQHHLATVAKSNKNTQGQG